jgi:hypothetical protein
VRCLSHLAHEDGERDCAPCGEASVSAGWRAAVMSSMEDAEEACGAEGIPHDVRTAFVATAQLSGGANDGRRTEPEGGEITVPVRLGWVTGARPCGDPSAAHTPSTSTRAGGFATRRLDVLGLFAAGDLEGRWARGLAAARGASGRVRGHVRVPLAEQLLVERGEGRDVTHAREERPRQVGDG